MQDIYRERILIKYIESKPIYEQLSIIDDYYNRTRKEVLLWHATLTRIPHINMKERDTALDISY